MLKARVVYNGYQWMKYYSERNKKVVIASDSEAIQTSRLLRAIALAMTFACNHIYCVYYMAPYCHECFHNSGVQQMKQGMSEKNAKNRKNISDHGVNCYRYF